MMFVGVVLIKIYKYSLQSNEISKGHKSRVSLQSSYTPTHLSDEPFLCRIEAISNDASNLFKDFRTKVTKAHQVKYTTHLIH